MSEWKSIESCPRNEWVLVWYQEEGISIAIKQNNLVESVFYDWDGDMYGTPTHWMPLPPPPTEQP